MPFIPAINTGLDIQPVSVRHALWRLVRIGPNLPHWGECLRIGLNLHSQAPGPLFVLWRVVQVRAAGGSGVGPGDRGNEAERQVTRASA